MAVVDTDEQFDQFQGTKTYIASEELRHAVNVAVALARPLLVRGEPGTGKTLLAENLAGALGLPLIRWHVKSTTKAKDGLYVYDTVARLHDSRFGGAVDLGADRLDLRAQEGRRRSRPGVGRHPVPRYAAQDRAGRRAGRQAGEGL